jgi:hypothetical protein
MSNGEVGDHRMTTPSFAMARGFSFKVLHTEDGTRKVARFICSTCGDCLDITNGSGGKAAEFFVARADRMGWAADARKRSKCYCPRCLGDMKAKQFAPERSPPQTSLPLGPVVISPPPSVIDDQPKQKEAVTVQTAIKPREPTAEERMRIRGFFDKCFDDAQGVYLDDMSDQKIGEEINVPWSLVTRIREMAYGPIRSDPELAALKTRQAALQTQMDQLKADIEAFGKRRAA